MRFFKLKKLRFFSENKFGKYLLYAVGEILLVVVGILLALQINNWNEGKKSDKLLMGILKNVSYDLERDTLLFNAAIAYYEVRREISDSILNNKFSESDLKKCIACFSLITTYYPVIINDKGYTQLKAFNENPKSRDSLAVDIVQFYNGFGDFVKELGQKVEKDALSNFEHWRDNYPWFPNIVVGQPDPDFQDYIAKDDDFRNRVALNYVLAGGNYLGALRRYRDNAIIVLERIAERTSEE